jgi:tyrosyl-tRNA synthetase
MMSPYAFYQFWLNVEDEKVGELLRIFTFLTRAEIEELEASTPRSRSLRAGQRALAEQVTALVTVPTRPSGSRKRRPRCSVAASSPA